MAQWLAWVKALEQKNPGGARLLLHKLSAALGGVKNLNELRMGPDARRLARRREQAHATARQALGALKLPPLPAVQLPRLPDVSGLRLPEIQGLWRQLDTDGDGKARRRHLPCGNDCRPLISLLLRPGE